MIYFDFRAFALNDMADLICGFAGFFEAIGQSWGIFFSDDDGHADAAIEDIDHLLGRGDHLRASAI